MMKTGQPAQSVASTIAILEKAKLRGKVTIAFDEWNLRYWHHPGFPGGGAGNPQIAERDRNDINSTYTMADAVFSACFLNTCIRNCKDVEIGGFSPVVNTRGALFVHPKGIVRRTTFHVLKLYASALEKNYLPSTLASETLNHNGQETSALDAIVTCDDAKRHFAVSAVNKHPEKALPLAIDFKNIAGSVPKQVSATVLSGSSPDDYNDIDAENRVVPVEKILKVTDGKVFIPPHSVTIISFEI
jgi:alpha-N-arabinofuranosidase